MSDACQTQICVFDVGALFDGKLFPVTNIEYKCSNHKLNCQLNFDIVAVDTYEIPADFQGEAMSIKSYRVFTKKIERSQVLWAWGNIDGS